MGDGRSESIIGGVGTMLDDLEELYKDVHRHPELSMEEERTAALAAERLRTAGFDVTTGVGDTGVVGLLRNGDGPTVMLRADMDALPVQEQTAFEYASTVDGVMHACGHDMHVAWLAGATAQLSATRDGWRGTLMAVFQPAEETATGAQTMIDDGLFDRFPKPVVVLGQHVMPAPAGRIGTRSSVITSAADSFAIRMFGRGAHGSMPEASIDPVVMAAATVLRLSNAPRPPEITPLDRYQLVRNDPDAAELVRRAFQTHFGEERVVDIPPLSASEDFGSFGSEWQVPSVFWTIGGTDPDTYRQAKEAGRLSELPTNHNPRSRQCSIRRSRRGWRRWLPERAPGSARGRR